MNKHFEKTISSTYDVNPISRINVNKWSVWNIYIWTYLWFAEVKKCQHVILVTGLVIVPVCVELYTIHWHCLSFDRQLSLWWFSSSKYSAFVESFFIRLGHSVYGQLSCRAAPEEVAIFVEICFEFGESLLYSTAQSHTVSLLHRNSRTPQDQRTIWTMP